MYKTFLSAAIVTSALILSNNVFANHHACWTKLSTMVQSLKLDDAQKAKIDPLMAQLDTTMKSSGDQMRDVSNQLDQLMWVVPMDQSAVDSLVDKKARLIADVMKAKISTQSQVITLLNTDQKAQLQSMEKKMQDKMSKQFKSCHGE